MTGQPCRCLEHPYGNSIRAVASVLNHAIESDGVSVEEAEHVFDMIDAVQHGLQQILAASEGNEALEDHFCGFAFDITAPRDGLLEHIPALVREGN